MSRGLCVGAYFRGFCSRGHHQSRGIMTRSRLHMPGGLFPGAFVQVAFTAGV